MPDAEHSAIKTIKLFRYIDELDAFVITDEYRHIAHQLGLAEWHEAVWVGRLFALDNDYGEHWFDNWDEREALAEQARALGLDEETLMIVVPVRFTNRRDGPCNNDALRKTFWTDVLRSLELSYDLLFEKARQLNTPTDESLVNEQDIIPDLDERIERIKALL